MAQTTNIGTFAIQKYVFMMQILQHSFVNKRYAMTAKETNCIGALTVLAIWEAFKAVTQSKILAELYEINTHKHTIYRTSMCSQFTSNVT